MEWQTIRLSGGDALAVRASKKLRSDELLVTSFAASRLRMELDRVPLWRGDHVNVRQIVDDFARYLYLPRLSGPTTLVHAVSDGLGMLTWETDSFGYADSHDDAAGRYRGLRGGQHVRIPDQDVPGLLVKPEVVRRQLAAEDEARKNPEGTSTSGGTDTGTGTGDKDKPGSGDGPSRPDATDITPDAPKAPRRYHGSVTLEAARVGRDASRVSEEVIAHLAGLVGSNVRVTLEIEADIPNGAPEQVVRTVTENSRTLKFTSHGFEEA